MFNNLNFSKKIMASLGLISMVILIAIGTTTFFTLKNDLEKRAVEELNQVNESTHNLIKSQVETAVKTHLKALSENTRSIVQNYYNQYYLEKKLTEREAYTLAKKMILNGFRRIGKTGYIAAANINGVLEIHPRSEGVDASAYKFMKRAIGQKNGFIEYEWKNIDDKKKRKKAGWLSYFEPWKLLIWPSCYRDEFNNPDFINIEVFSEKINSVRLGKTGYTYIIDKEGKLVVHPFIQNESALDFEDKNGKKFIQEILKKKNGRITYYWKNPDETDEREKLIFFKHIENLDWIICSGVYFDELYEPVDRLKNIIKGISILSLFLITLFSLYISRSLTKSIKRLTDGAKSIGAGNLDIKIPVESKDEIGSLAETFNSMARSLKTSKKELEKAKIELEDKVKELEIQKEKAEKASKAKNIFLGNMSHEIRTPLTSILGHTELLLPIISNSKQRDSLINIKASSKTLKDFIDNTLYMSKIEAEKLIIRNKPTNIYSILTEMRGSFTFAINKKGIKYYDYISENIPQWVELDELRVKQVLINLINNAIKYTDKGYVKVSIDMEQRNLEEIDLKFAVEDSGIGISKKDQKKLFELFERLEGDNKKVRDGAGLGLALSKKIINLMGGEICLESNPGKGSIFVFVLYSVKVPKNQGIFDDEEDFNFSKIIFDDKKILIVEDEENTRKIIKGYLEGTRIKVFEAENGKKALDLIDKVIPDLILMDIKMPIMDGIDATQKIRENDSLKNIPIVAFTASKTEEDEVEKYKHLFEDYLFKPITKAKFIHKISKHLKPNLFAEIIDIDSILLTSDNSRNLLKIIEQLEASIEVCEAVMEEDNFNNYKEFGSKIKVIGEKFSFQILSDFGTQVIEYAKIYDLKGIKLLLEKFPILIEKLKELKQEAS